MVNFKATQLGTTTRMNFATIDEVMQMPNLIDVQKKSYQWLVDEGLKEVLRGIGDITSSSGKHVINFIDYSLGEKPNHSIAECKMRKLTHSVELYFKVQWLNKNTGEITEKDIFMGNIPLMTDSATFIVNGAERAIVSQLVRSPGIYYDMSYDKTGKELFTSQIIPNRGAWLEYETDYNNLFYVKIDKNKKILITTFIRALGLGSNEEILNYFGNDERIIATLEKDQTIDTDSALLNIYEKHRPSEPATIDSAKSLIDGFFFDARRYDLSRVGRYKYNKKLAIASRLVDQKLAQPIVDELTGELLAEAGEVITAEKAAIIEQAGVSAAFVDVEGAEIKVVSNGMVDALPYLASLKITEADLEEIAINEKVRYNILMDILQNTPKKKKDVLAALEERADDLIPKHVIVDDILASINYLNNIASGIGSIDDIDHLGNRRIRSVGELLQNQFRIGFSRLEKSIREKLDQLSVEDAEKANEKLSNLVNAKLIAAAINDFFSSSPLSQFMDQTNPLSELTNKRRLSALGPGGLSRERAGFEVRDVHYSHYGRMCPIETPEGPNIGLISSLATFARINKYGFIETPFRRVDKKTGKVLDDVVYMTADEEDAYRVAQANEPLDKDGHFMRDKVTIRYRDEFAEVDNNQADFMDVSPKMLVSVATAMIPFLENDDANRALMGSNMQKQAVPLMKTEAPIVGTGMEYKAAVDSGVVVVSKTDGTVVSVDASTIEIEDKGGNIDKYDLVKFMRSNQGTCITQHPIVEKGQKVKAGDVIADGPATANGEISLGKNALIGFMTWEGYNYEDAVLLNEKLVRDDVYTSIHIQEYEVVARQTKLGPEEITRDVPNAGAELLADLDENGIIRIGAEVHSGSILVGKVTPKTELEQSNQAKLLRAIFAEKAREVRDTSLKMPHGEYGIVIDVKVFDKENYKEIPNDVEKIVRCYVAQKRKIQVGDKMAGRHGNKGVVSRILPQEDMPFLPDGTPLDIVLNPLGVPSRMNIGQVLEVNMGMAARSKGWKVMTPVFDGAHEDDIQYLLVESKLLSEGSQKVKELVLQYEDKNEAKGFALDDLIKFLKSKIKDEEELAFIDAAYEYRFGKTQLIDGRTGKPFDNPVTVGVMYYLKLHHLVDDKIHARSVGPYALVTQQPLGGKAQFGGQRFGEMEVWALEAYGAAYTLQEILTIKSDDINGRNRTFKAIVKGTNIPRPGAPESFKVLIKELQAICIDIKVYDDDGNEIDLKQNFDDEYEDKNTASASAFIEEIMPETVSDDDDYIDLDAIDESEFESDSSKEIE